ncbi:MAG: hypothetical protein ACK5B9_04315 [Flavobacteriia bacterium]|jgi:hypothetical protein
MKKILGLNFIALSIFILSSCHTSKKVVTENPNSKPIDETPLVGNDADEHGCKNSAGYTWSILKNECVRIFEAGSSFISVDKSQSLGAFVIISSDNKQTEIFLPTSKTSLILQASSKYNATGEKVLFENNSEKLSISQGPNSFQIQQNGVSVFTQIYASDYGLGIQFSSWTPETPIVGNDTDEYGCKASAGFSWSQLKNSCVRIWETGSSFISINTNETSAAYVILSDDLKRAEVYVPTQKKSILLEKAINSDKTIIFENKTENIEIIQTKTHFTIRINKKELYQQIYSKELGLGVKF